MRHQTPKLLYSFNLSVRKSYPASGISIISLNNQNIVTFKTCHVVYDDWPAQYGDRILAFFGKLAMLATCLVDLGYGQSESRKDTRLQGAGSYLQLSSFLRGVY